MEVIITPDDDWFENPLDKMPVATDKGGVDWEDTAPSEYEPPTDNRWAPPERRAELDAELAPRPEEDIAGWFKDETEPLDIPIEETLHEKMYKMATNRYNPFSVGGSENCDSDISCNKLGGSEEVRPSTPN